MSNNKKPIALAVGVTLISGIAMTSSAFAMSDLSSGYLLGAAAQAEKAAEGKCGEGKCGIEKLDTDKDGQVSQAEFGAAHDGDTSRFAHYDTDKDGMISTAELKAGHEGKCGEGKCGGEKGGEGSCGADKKDKADMEGKCGEGKCGGTV
jgi:uncharacterized low-complexity protein